MGGRFEEQAADRRCPGKGFGVPVVGPEREVAGAIPRGACDHEQQSALVAAAWVCVLDAAGRCLCFRAATSSPGADERQIAVVQRAGCDHADGDDRACGRKWSGSGTAGSHRHPTGTKQHGIRADVQSGSCVRIVAIPVLPAILRGSPGRVLFRRCARHGPRIHRGRRDRRWPMGMGEPLLGRRIR